MGHSIGDIDVLDVEYERYGDIYFMLSQWKSWEIMCTPLKYPQGNDHSELDPKHKQGSAYENLAGLRVRSASSGS